MLPTVSGALPPSLWARFIMPLHGISHVANATILVRALVEVKMFAFQAKIPHHRRHNLGDTTSSSSCRMGTGTTVAPSGRGGGVRTQERLQGEGVPGSGAFVINRLWLI
jgi:hypothetical protein